MFIEGGNLITVYQNGSEARVGGTGTLRISNGGYGGALLFDGTAALGGEALCGVREIYISNAGNLGLSESNGALAKLLITSEKLIMEELADGALSALRLRMVVFKWIFVSYLFYTCVKLRTIVKLFHLQRLTKAL
jgi:hypothetical protein